MSHLAWTFTHTHAHTRLRDASLIGRSKRRRWQQRQRWWWWRRRYNPSQLQITPRHHLTFSPFSHANPTAPKNPSTTTHHGSCDNMSPTHSCNYPPTCHCRSHPQLPLCTECHWSLGACSQSGKLKCENSTPHAHVPFQTVKIMQFLFDKCYNHFD